MFRIAAGAYRLEGLAASRLRGAEGRSLTGCATGTARYVRCRPRGFRPQARCRHHATLRSAGARQSRLDHSSASAQPPRAGRSPAPGGCARSRLLERRGVVRAVRRARDPEAVRSASRSLRACRRGLELERRPAHQARPRALPRSGTDGRAGPHVPRDPAPTGPGLAQPRRRHQGGGRRQVQAQASADRERAYCDTRVGGALMATPDGRRRVPTVGEDDGARRAWSSDAVHVLGKPTGRSETSGAATASSSTRRRSTKVNASGCPTNSSSGTYGR